MSQNKPTIGFIDTIENDYAYGWAVDLEAPSENITVEVLCNNHIVGSGKTGAYRSDLEKINPSIKNSGFRIKVVYDKKASAELTFVARKLGSVEVLEGSVTVAAKKASSNSKDAIELYRKGKDYFDSKSWKHAEEYLKKALGLGFHELDIHWLLALTITRLGRTWESLKYYESAHIADPENLEKLVELAKTYERMECTAEAVKSFNAACLLAPKNSDLHYSLGLNLRNVGKNDEAEVAFASAIKFDTSNQSKRFGIGALHARKGFWNEAIIDYRNEIAKNGNKHPAIFYRLGMAYEKSYSWDEAIAYYSQAVNLDCTDYYWHYRLGLCYERKQLWGHAASAFKNAIKRNENFDPALYGKLAEILSRSNDLTAANETYKLSAILSKNYGIDDTKDRQNEGFRVVNDYTEMYKNLSIDEKSVLFESYHGASISCNPYAIFKEIFNDENFAGWTHIWVINDKGRIPAELRNQQNLIFVKKDSDLYRFYLSTCKFLINNSTFPPYFMRKPDQVYLNTWHGTPQKTLFKDINNGEFGHKNIARNFLHATHLLAPNLHTEKVLLDSNDISEIFPGKVLRIGYPRIDLMLNASEATQADIYKKLRIPRDKPVILFAPTYREGQTEDDLKKLKFDLETLYSSEYTVLFRGHYFVEEKLNAIKSPVKVVPQEIDTCELLSIVSILITDYSSIFFDFLPKNKTILFYLPDYARYKKERGLYIEKDELPGVCFGTIQETKNHLEKLLRKPKISLHPNHKICLKAFCGSDKGHSTKDTIAAFFFDKTNQNDSRQSSKKKHILFFAGGFIPNGITSSFINLVKSIDREKYSITVAIDPGVVLLEPDRMEQIQRILPFANVIARCGRMNITLEEKWIASKITTSYSVDSEELMRPYKASYRREFLRNFGYAKFDSIINFEGYSQFWSALFAFGSKSLDAKKSIYLHSNMYEEMKTRFPNLRGIISTYKHYDSLISVTDKVRQENMELLHQSFNIPPSRFRYVKNALLPDEIIKRAEEKDECHKLPWPTKDNYIFLTMGRLSPEKDHEKLIRAFQIVHKKQPSTKLVIVGQGPLKSHLEAVITELRLGNAIYLAGQQYNPFPLLKQASCFVLSSNHEGQGMVLLEALTLDKPVMSTDISGPRSVLEDGYGLLVGNNIKALALGMQDIFSKKVSFREFDPAAYAEDAMIQFYREA